MLNFPDIKLGSVVSFNNQPCVITSCEFLRMQQRKPVKKCKMKNLITGSNQEYSFKSGEAIEEADLRREPATFMYSDSDTISFMLTNSYETVDLPKEILGDKTGYIKESLEVNIMYFNDAPISVDLPIKISYKIIHTTESARGNTVSDVLKEATIETGKVVRVPNFIKEGEKVMINTVEDEYVSRDTENK